MKKAIRITTENETIVFELKSDSLEQLQQAVGGYVQAIDLSDKLTLWCNEEGKMINLPHNRGAQKLWDEVFGAGTDYIVGDIVLTGGADRHGNTLGLTDAQVKKYEQPKIHNSPDIPDRLWDEWDNHERQLWLDSDESWWLDTISYEEWNDHLAKKYLTPNAYSEWRCERDKFIACSADDDVYRNKVLK